MAQHLISPQTTKVGWIGTGVMGKSMCGHLLKAGFPVTIYNRSPEKTRELVAQGAAVASTPAAVAEASDDRVCKVYSYVVGI